MDAQQSNELIVIGYGFLNGLAKYRCAVSPVRRPAFNIKLEFILGVLWF